MKIGLIDLPSLHRKNWRATEHKSVSEAYKNTLTEVDDWSKNFDRILLAIDRPPYFRSSIFPEYKAHREETPPEVPSQLGAIVDTLSERFEIVGVESFEADDIIATCVKSLKGSHRITIVSTDLDMLALIDDGITVVSPITGAVMNAQSVMDKLGIKPSQVADFKALAGDKSDNIPGVPRIGAKTAAGMLQKHGDIRGVLSNVGSYTDAVNKNLTSSETIVLQSMEVIKLRDDVPLPDGWKGRLLDVKQPAPLKAVQDGPYGPDPAELDDDVTPPQGTALSDRMSRVMAGIRRLKKTGWNQHHRYHFATDADVSDMVRNLLAAEGIEFNAEVMEILSDVERGKQRIVTCRFLMHFRAGDEHRQLSWIAEAADTADKALNKCATAAVKYFLLKNFVIATGDDADAGPGPMQENDRSARDRYRRTTNAS